MEDLDWGFIRTLLLIFIVFVTLICAFNSCNLIEKLDEMSSSCVVDKV